MSSSLSWTSKMTLSHLAAAGDPDASNLFRAMGLDADEIIDSPATILSKEYRLTRTALLNMRYNALNATLQDGPTVVDIPCGLSPRGMLCLRNGRSYLGIDLPPVICSLKEKLPLPDDGEKPSLLRYEAADALDPEALLSAVEGCDGELHILTEGFLMYLSGEETGRFMEGIARLLSIHGGCFITADPEMSIQNFLTLAAICGDDLPEVIKRGFLRKPVSSGETLPEPPSEKSPLMLDVFGDTGQQLESAEEYLLQFGMKLSRITVSDHLKKPVLPGMLTPKQSEDLFQAMQKVCFWKITLTSGK